MAAYHPLPAPERHARISHWTMYYLAALVLPAIEHGVRTGRVPPTAIHALVCERHAEGHVTGFRPRGGLDGVPATGGFSELVDGHLTILAADCRRLAGFPTRVTWSNAGVMIAHGLALAQTAAPCDPAALRAAESLLSDAHPALSRPIQNGRRRVCCLRDRLPGGAPCPGLCPRLRSGAQNVSV